MSLVARAKSLLARVTLVIEFCHDCGRRQPLVWWADDALWARFAGQAPTILCPACFDKRAERQGVLLRWVPTIDPDSLEVTP